MMYCWCIPSYSHHFPIILWCIINGLYMDYIWIIYGLYMDYIWIIIGLFMDYLWIIYWLYGLFMDYDDDISECSGLLWCIVGVSHHIPIHFFHYATRWSWGTYETKTTYISGWWFQPLWKILVSWDYYSQYMEKSNMFQTSNQTYFSWWMYIFP